jgi:hypothetical protein
LFSPVFFGFLLPRLPEAQKVGESIVESVDPVDCRLRLWRSRFDIRWHILLGSDAEVTVDRSPTHRTAVQFGCYSGVGTEEEEKQNIKKEAMNNENFNPNLLTQTTVCV